MCYFIPCFNLEDHEYAEIACLPSTPQTVRVCSTSSLRKAERMPSMLPTCSGQVRHLYCQFKDVSLLSSKPADKPRSIAPQLTRNNSSSRIPISILRRSDRFKQCVVTFAPVECRQNVSCTLTLISSIIDIHGSLLF